MRDRAHDEAMAEMFREDPAYAVQLLNSILEEGDQSELLITLRQMAKAFGGVPTVAETAHLSTTQLYRTLSPKGIPCLAACRPSSKPWDCALQCKLCGLRMHTFNAIPQSTSA